MLSAAAAFAGFTGLAGFIGGAGIVLGGGITSCDEGTGAGCASTTAGIRSANGVSLFFKAYLSQSACIFSQ